MARFRKYTARRRPAADINITNLVDVMMVLLIIFIIVSPFLKEGLRIQLPKVKVAERLGQRSLLVEMDQHGVIAVNGNEVAMDTLISHIETEHAKHPDWPVHIKVDHRNLVGPYMKVLSTMRAAGIEEVGQVVDEDEQRL